MSLKSTICYTGRNPLPNCCEYGSGVRALATELNTPDTDFTTAQDVKNIASTLAVPIAFGKALREADIKWDKTKGWQISKEETRLRQQIALELRIVLDGMKTEHYSISPKNFMEYGVYQSLRREKKWWDRVGKPAENTAVQSGILLGNFGGDPMAIFNPYWDDQYGLDNVELPNHIVMRWVPAARFMDTTYQNMDVLEYLKDKNSLGQEEYHAFLTLTDSIAPRAMHSLKIAMDTIHGVLDKSALDKYKAKSFTEIDGDVAGYFGEVGVSGGGMDTLLSKCSHPKELICGQMGENNRIHPLPKLMAIEHNQMESNTTAANGLFLSVTGRYYYLAPYGDNIKEYTLVGSVQFIENFGTQKQNEVDIPDFVSVQANFKNNEGKIIPTFHKYQTSDIEFCHANTLLDCNAGAVPGLLKEYVYLDTEYNIEAPMETDEQYLKKFSWDLSSSETYEVKNILRSGDSIAPWKLYIQSSASAVDRIRLLDNLGNTVGTVFPEIPGMVSGGDQAIEWISIDPACSTAVRLQTQHPKEGICGNAVNVPCLIKPMTPIDDKQLDRVLKQMDPRSTCDSLDTNSIVQRDDMNPDPAKTKVQSVQYLNQHRIWQPEDGQLLEVIQNSKKGMPLENNGLLVHVKKNLIGIPSISLQCQNAYTAFVANLLMEAILSETRNVKFSGLRFLISYPEFSNDGGIAAQCKTCIENAIILINKRLSDENKLTLGENVHLFTESDSANSYIEAFHAPASGLPALILDMGSSTSDGYFRLGSTGKYSYSFSLPYAADKITLTSLKEVFDRNFSLLGYCFYGDERVKDIISFLNTHETPFTKDLIEELFRISDTVDFNPTGKPALYQKLLSDFQDATAMRLSCLVPACASVIGQGYVPVVFGAQDGIDEDIAWTATDVYLVGKGSLAFSNTPNGFLDIFGSRINQFLDDIWLKPNGKLNFIKKVRIVDKHRHPKKAEVAQGLLELGRKGSFSHKTPFLESVTPNKASLENLLDNPNLQMECQKFYENYVKIPGELGTKVSAYLKDSVMFATAQAAVRTPGNPWESLILSVPFVEMYMLFASIVDYAISDCC